MNKQAFFFVLLLAFLGLSIFALPTMGFALFFAVVATAVADESRVVGIKDGIRWLTDFPERCSVCSQKFKPYNIDELSHKADVECLKKEVKDEKGEVIGTPMKPKNVLASMAVAVLTEPLEKMRNDSLKLLIERNRVQHEISRLNINLREIVSGLTVMVTEECSNCHSKVIYTISMEATKEISSLFMLPLPSGMLLSEWEKEHKIERDFEIYPADSPEKISDLTESQSLLPIFIANPPNFNSKKWQSLRWKLSVEPGEKKGEAIKVFEDRINVLLSDIAKTQTIIQKAADAVKLAVNELQCHDSRYILSDVAGVMERDVADKILKSLKRSLLENIIYLDDEIARLVAAGEI